MPKIPRKRAAAPEPNNDSSPMAKRTRAQTKTDGGDKHAKEKNATKQRTAAKTNPKAPPRTNRRPTIDIIEDQILQHPCENENTTANLGLQTEEPSSPSTQADNIVAETQAEIHSLPTPNNRDSQPTAQNHASVSGIFSPNVNANTESEMRLAAAFERALLAARSGSTCGSDSQLGN